MADFRRAKTLVKSIRYPTFQFWAAAKNSKITAEEQFVIAVLTTLEWLRTKFSEFEIPDEIDMPNADSYESVSMDDFQSVHINEGYTVDVICLPKQKIWSFRLIEPDLSTKTVDGKEISTAVPGRMFQTEISFAVVDQVLQCGIKITVSEPENQSEPCKAYRPYIVQVLLEDPRLGFACGYPIGGAVWALNKVERVRQLRDYLSAGNLPAVILCDYEDRSKKGAPPGPLHSAAPFMNAEKNIFAPGKLPPQFIPAGIEQLIPKANPAAEHESSAETPYDAASLLKYRTCYAHYFQCSKKMFPVLQKYLSVEPRSGDIIIMGTAPTGGAVTVFSLSNGPEENIRKVLDYLLDYPNGKQYRFGNIAFYDAARVLQIEEISALHAQGSDEANLLRQEIDVLNKRIDDLQKERVTEATQYEKKIRGLNDTVSKAKEQIEEIRDDAAARIRQAEQERNRYSARVAYHESISLRPKKPDGIPKWVETRLADRLILHSKAIKLINAVSPDEVDMPLLCDALEYLAFEYRDMRMRLITEDEMNHLCSEKYGRPFTVTPIGDGTIEYASSDYKIKYKIGAKGKPVETPMDLHLKVGNTTGKLIRIYFLYDREKDLVVVGSLPRHLKTKTYS